MNNRIWTKWSDKRTPNDNKTYRFRVYATILGTNIHVEWSEKQSLCGMGYADSQYWPLSPCHWNGYKRYITHDGLEWSESVVSDSEKVTFNGLNLLPCPFTGNQPEAVWHGRYIGAAPYELEWIGIKSHMVSSIGWTDVREMCNCWNKRPTN